jgi:hypothetical protein
MVNGPQAYGSVMRWVWALLSALLLFRLLPRGFANRDLREYLAPLLGEAPSMVTQGRMT